MELLRPDSQEAQARRYDWQRGGILNAQADCTRGEKVKIAMASRRGFDDRTKRSRLSGIYKPGWQPHTL